MPGIGQLNEKPLHASLKQWLALPGDLFEVPVDGYVIDIVRDDLLLEIQTGSFSSMKSKLFSLLPTHRIRLIYPIPQEKWIIKLATGDDGENRRRKSPKRGRVEDLFGEAVSFPQLLTNDNLALEVLLIREEEVRRYDEKRNWRRRGWGTEERRLLEVVDRRLFDKPADWRALLPESLGSSFTTADLAKATGMKRKLAQQMAYCLRHMHLIELTGKKGRSNLYEIVDAESEES